MADQEQLKILKQGTPTWNKWREENPDIKIDLYKAHLLSGANLQATPLIKANLSKANLSKANLSEANFSGADLSGANLSGADLLYANLSRVDFIKANLSGADLSGARLYDADLNGADLSGADLSKADLRKANLSGADLILADLREANLREANLSGANLNEADLRLANFFGANIYEADLTNVFLGFTILADNDLSATIGLETIVHKFPSSIGTNTLQRFKGKIPTNFLRGCGLSDLEIESAKLAAPGLDHEQVAQITYEIHRLYLDQPIQFYSCFISYNNKDQAFAQRLHDDLQNNGVRCWYAPEDMKIGDRIRPTIDHQIRMREKLLVILSENAIQSEWVGDEVEAALEQEKESGKTVLFPIRLDDAVLNTRDDWAAKIKRRRNIGDFSTDYNKALTRLLRDLKPTTLE
jgi:uncharacterized protein YjbI with pentapeptide repeats